MTSANILGQTYPTILYVERAGLRFVPGVRSEFMSRLWHALSIGFYMPRRSISSTQLRDYFFLRPMRLSTISYHMDSLYMIPNCNSTLRITGAFLAFVCALEQMAFSGTVHLTGRQEDIELARCYIDKMNKYWRLGNDIAHAHELTCSDGVWGLVNHIFRFTPLSLGFIGRPPSVIHFDMVVDFRPPETITGISEEPGSTYLTRTADPVDPVDGEPWCWQKIVHKKWSPGLLGYYRFDKEPWDRRLDELRYIKEGYMKTKHMLSSMIEARQA